MLTPHGRQIADGATYHMCGTIGAHEKHCGGVKNSCRQSLFYRVKQLNSVRQLMSVLGTCSADEASAHWVRAKNNGVGERMMRDLLRDLTGNRHNLSLIHI